MTGDSKMIGADIRAKLDHPVVDADGHMLESTFAVLDFVKQVGGTKLAARYEEMMRPDQPGRERGAVCSRATRTPMGGPAKAPCCRSAVAASTAPPS